MKIVIPRFPELDLWRGLAIIAMLIFHYFFVLDFFDIQPMAYREGGWHVLGQFARLSFLVLVGIGMHLSYQKHMRRKQSLSDYRKHQVKRGLLVLACGMLITFVTLLTIEEQGVRFGVLHLIGASIILLSLVAHRPKLCLLIALIVFAGSTSVWGISAPYELYPFGFQTTYYPAIDYFPIFPWLSAPALGVWIASVLFQNYKRLYPSPPAFLSIGLAEQIAVIGKHSLLIYMIHVPIIVALVWLIYL